MLDDSVVDSLKTLNTKGAELIQGAFYKSLKEHLGEVPPPHEVNRYGSFRRRQRGMDTFYFFEYKGVDLFKYSVDVADGLVLVKIEYLNKE